MRLAFTFLIPALLGAQNAPMFTIEKFATGFVYLDGPAWSPENFLVFNDVPTNRSFRVVPGEKIEKLRDSAGPMGSAFDAQGRLYLCEARERRVIRLDKKSRVEVLADKWDGKRFNGPNDIAVRKDGEVYFSDPAFGYQQDRRELSYYGVYHLSRHNTLELVAKSKGRPNGVALSPNGRILYVTNSDERNVRAYDLEKNGAASNERVVIRDIPGVPNGLRTDDSGDLYMAAAELFIYSPDGKLLRTVNVPETPSNLTFGDADMRSLYITARTSVYRIRVGPQHASQ